MRGIKIDVERNTTCDYVHQATACSAARMQIFTVSSFSFLAALFLRESITLCSCCWDVRYITLGSEGSFITVLIVVMLLLCYVSYVIHYLLYTSMLIARLRLLRRFACRR